MVRALVTGATGCVGANIVEALLARGYEVRALRRESSALDALTGLTPEMVMGDVLDSDSLRAAMTGCQLVFHAAAISQYWRNKPDLIYTVNVIGTRNVLEAARSRGVDRVVFTSSVAALGVPTRSNQLITEEAWYNWPPGRFHYGHSKLLAEGEVGRAVARGLDVVSVNPTTVIGRRDVNHVGGEILRVVKKGWFLLAPPGGMGVVSAQATGIGHVLAAERGRTGERYILSGENISHRRMMEIVASVVGGTPPLATIPRTLMRGAVALAWQGLKFAGVDAPSFLAQMDLSTRDMYFDGSKATRELGMPYVDAATAIREAWSWYRQQGEL